MENPYVSASIKRLRKRLKGNQEGLEQLKTDVKSAVQKGVDDFVFRLDQGQIKIDNVTDFEKLVKVGLLVHGEPTEKVEVTTDIEEVHMETLNAIKDTEEFDKIRQMLAEQMNKINEEG